MFYKMVATGNDFVAVDNRKKVIADAPSFARKVCDRHFGIGGDGLLLLENSGKADYKMRIINADGSEAEACGNGFRCISLLAHEKLGFSKKQCFESLAGMIDATVDADKVRVRLMDPEDLSGEEKIALNGRKLPYYFIRVGVPHVVMFVKTLAEFPVTEMGRTIRNHQNFAPAGTNVNFVEVKDSYTLLVDTYERGVEANTLACGTGSTASAIVSAVIGRVKPPVRVKTRGGEMLTINFEKKGEKIHNVYLEGKARLVFEGKLKP